MEALPVYGDRRTNVNALVIGVAFLFIVANYFIVRAGYYTGFLVPVSLSVVLLVIFSPLKAWMLAILVTPVSIFLNAEGLASRISFPGELLLALLALSVIINFSMGARFDRQFMRHPLTLWILAGLGWMAVTVFTSELPLVSVKYLVSRIWFLFPIYFGGSCFLVREKNIRLFLWLHSISLLSVVAYTTYRHFDFGFSERAGHWVMDPFYNDHTAYGAVLALSIPLMIALLFDKGLKTYWRLAAGTIAAAFAAGLVLSGSRAAWISLVAAVLVFLWIRLRIRLTWLVVAAATVFIIVLASDKSLYKGTERYAHSASKDVVMRVQSITNVTTDASNLERINRWKSALRMFNERPILGWGPGTYQFEYAPYQLSREKTVISTDLGDVGSVHSEYLGPLAEMGLPGFLLFVIFAATLIYKGLKIFKYADTEFTRHYSLAATLALLTYLVHGFMNNFLETDKLSVPFWALAAMITLFDCRQRKSGTE